MRRSPGMRQCDLPRSGAKASAGRVDFARAVAVGLAAQRSGGLPSAHAETNRGLPRRAHIARVCPPCLPCARRPADCPRMPARTKRSKAQQGNSNASGSRGAARAAEQPAADEQAVEPAVVDQREDGRARRLCDFFILSGRFSVAGFGRVRPVTPGNASDPHAYAMQRGWVLMRAGLRRKTARPCAMRGTPSAPRSSM